MTRNDKNGTPFASSIIDLQLNKVFRLTELSVFVDGHEMLIIVSELRKGNYTANYIIRYGCEEYFTQLFYERQNGSIMEIAELDL